MNSLELPEPLAVAAGFLSRPFPNGREADDGYWGLMKAYGQFSGKIRLALATMDGHAQRAIADTKGPAIDAFAQDYHHPESPQKNLRDATTGTNVFSASCGAAGCFILAEKGYTILQYALTLAALAAGGVAVFLIKQIGQRVLDEITNFLVSAVMS